MILFGSRAIKYHFPDFYREPKDWDFIVHVRGLKSNIDGVEYKHIKPILDDLRACRCELEVLDPDRLLTLKMSHLLYDNQWEKHMEDVQFLLKKGAKLRYGLFFDLVNWWRKVLPKQRRSNLNMTKEQFFKNKINYKIDHDMIHEILNPHPTFRNILKAGADVDVSSHKFNLLTDIQKNMLVREEVYVMAWERKRHLGYREAYSWMLKKFIIGHAPLWEMIYIVLNYENLKHPIINFINYINHELNARGINYDDDREGVPEVISGQLQHN